MKKKKSIVFWVLLSISCLYLIKSCDLVQRMHNFSDSIEQSKLNNLFIKKVNLINVKVASIPKSGSELFKVLNFSGWLERTGRYQGEKLLQTDNKSFTIVFDIEFDRKFELNKDNYCENWAFYYNKDGVEGSPSTINNFIQMNFKLENDSIQKPIELKIEKFNIRFEGNDRSCIGSLILTTE